MLFNLVDDLIEPFRAFVDLWIWQITQQEDKTSNNLSKEQRIKLLQILQQPIIVGNDKTMLLNGCELVVDFFCKSS